MPHAALTCHSSAGLGRFDYEHGDGIPVRALIEPRVDDAELPVGAKRDRVARPP
jgi:hypothetical protein